MHGRRRESGTNSQTFGLLELEDEKPSIRVNTVLSYSPYCKACGWEGFSCYSPELAEESRIAHDRSVHPYVMEMQEKIKSLEEIVGVANEMVYTLQRGSSPYCSGCGFNNEANEHQDACIVVKFRKLQETLGLDNDYR